MSNGIKLRKIYRVGSCVGWGALADKSLGWKKVRFYARAFLLEHPQHGLILIDVGYGEAAIQALKKGMRRIYSALLPVRYRPEDRLILQLAQDGIAPKDLSYLVLTHYHPDHIGSLPEWSETRWIYRKDALDELRKQSRFRQLCNGFLSELVGSIPKNSCPILNADLTTCWNGFAAHDFFGDGSFYLVDLPGHALGQMGVATENLFFAADAVWSSQGEPHGLGFYLQADPKAYRRTFSALQTLSSNIQIIPTHEIEHA